MSDGQIRKTLLPMLVDLGRRKWGIGALGVLFLVAAILVDHLLFRFILFIIAGSCFSFIILTARRKEHPTDSRVEEAQAPVHFTAQPNPARQQPQPETTPPYAEPMQDRREFTPRAIREVRPKLQERYSISDFFDVGDEAPQKPSSPQEELKNLMRKLLGVVKEVCFAHTAAIFWVNKSKGHMVIESYVTDSDKFTTERRRELGNDLVSKVAFEEQPVLLNEINTSSQPELLGYYNAIEQVSSFAAVPIFFTKSSGTPPEVIGVLVVDSLGEDMYGPETIVTLGHFTKLVSELLQTYTDKYDLLMDSVLLQSIGRIRENLSVSDEERTIVRTLAEETSKLVAWESIAVVLFDESKRAWVVQTVLNRSGHGYIEVGQEIDPENSLVGRALAGTKPFIVNLKKEQNVPRFVSGEPTGTRGSILLLPILSKKHCFGVLVVESKDEDAYSEQNIKTLRSVSEPASDALEIFGLKSVVDNFVLVDETTGVSSKRYFQDRIHQEYQRAFDFGDELSLVMVAIDNADELEHRHAKEGLDYILWNIGRIIKSSIRSYDVLARFDKSQFAVLLANTSSSDSHIWAEKLRKNIAGNVIHFEEKSFSVTMSAGIASITDNCGEQGLIDRANQVLRKAQEAGGNLVRIY